MLRLSFQRHELSVFRDLRCWIRIYLFTYGSKTAKTFIVVLLIFIKVYTIFVTILSLLLLFAILFLLSSIFQHIRHFETLLGFWYSIWWYWGSFILRFALVSRSLIGVHVLVITTLISPYIIRIFEDYLLFIFLVLDKLFSLGFREFGKINSSLPVIEGYNVPLLGLVIELRLFDNLFYLIVCE